jgi:hypothetical protein
LDVAAERFGSGCAHTALTRPPLGDDADVQNDVGDAVGRIACDDREDLRVQVLRDVTVECPSRSLTTFIETSAASARLAQVCRRSWNRMTGCPASVANARNRTVT